MTLAGKSGAQKTIPPNGPTFIGVGPEKTGTTWIDRQLRKHSEVWLPPVKELRYFWEKNRFPGETGLGRLNLKGSWHRKQYAGYAKTRLKQWIRHPVRNILAGPGPLFWDFRYLFCSHSDRWYLSCFENRKQKICGEISPQYFFLPKQQIEQIGALLPGCKIVITLRRPLEWVWSFAKMNTRGGFLVEKYGDLDTFIDRKIADCSFSRAVENWKSVYGASQVLVLFFDNLEADPWQYYVRICEFLEIVPDTNIRSTVADRVNKGSEEPIPEKYIVRITDGWRNDIRELSHLVADIPQSWLD